MKNLLKLGTPLSKEVQQQILGGNAYATDNIMYYCNPNDTPGCNCFESTYYSNGWHTTTTCQQGGSF